MYSTCFKNAEQRIGICTIRFLSKRNISEFVGTLSKFILSGFKKISREKTNKICITRGEANNRTRDS